MRTAISNCGRTTPLSILLATALIWMALAPASSHAQHVMGPMGSNSEVEVESVPADDEILPSPPADLLIRFSTYVRLVKLTLKAPDGDPVDIGFRYQGEVSRVFLWNLPELPAADYYTVEWAAIDPSNLVARGSFNFAFGPGARRPSELIPEEEILAPVIVPDFRLIDQR
ncbi:MAG: copper resistance protein CopC [Gammaproteobacteria bacterium]|nr:copper resistance protein CopC [Gammaproteobacteria bacterium]MDP2140079.1 copper resistance protein CopC [Gammaproteobacteria bacterium]MDP2347641.1 copper resistance protein CopC [Gammaproteobacteria bacterium]